MNSNLFRYLQPRKDKLSRTSHHNCCTVPSYHLLCFSTLLTSLTSRIFETTYCTMLFKIFTFIWTAGATTSVRIFGTEHYYYLFFLFILAKFQTCSSFLFETFSCVRSFSFRDNFFLEFFFPAVIWNTFFSFCRCFSFLPFSLSCFVFSFLSVASNFSFKTSRCFFYLLILFLPLLFLECTSSSFDLVTDLKSLLIVAGLFWLLLTDSLLIRGRTGAAIWKSGSVLDFSKILGVIGCSMVAHMLAPPGMHGAETLGNLDPCL